MMLKHLHMTMPKKSQQKKSGDGENYFDDIAIIDFTLMTKVIAMKKQKIYCCISLTIT